MRHEILWLSRQDVERVGVPGPEIIRAVEEVLQQQGVGAVKIPPKIGIQPTRVAFFQVMPGLVVSARAAGIKWVSAFGAGRRPGDSLYILRASVL